MNLKKPVLFLTLLSSTNIVNSQDSLNTLLDLNKKKDVILESILLGNLVKDSGRYEVHDEIRVNRALFEGKAKNLLSQKVQSNGSSTHISITSEFRYKISYQDNSPIHKFDCGDYFLVEDITFKNLGSKKENQELEIFGFCDYNSREKIMNFYNMAVEMTSKNIPFGF